MTKRTRVQWDDAEIDILAKEFVRLRLLGTPRVLAVQEAQKLLPEARHRNISTMSQMPPSWENRTDYFFRAAKHESQQKEEAARQPAYPTNEEILAQLSIQMTDIQLEILAEKMLKKIEEKYPGLAQFAAAMSGTTASVPVAPATTGITVPKTTRVVKPTVVIAGILNKQLQHLLNEFPRLHIKCIHKGTSTKDVKNILANAYEVLGMTDHMSHSLEATIVSHVPKGVYTRVSGHLTAFRKELSRIQLRFEKESETRDA